MTISRRIRWFVIALGTFCAFGASGLYGGGKPAALYRVSMSSPSFEAIVTDCPTNTSNYLVGRSSGGSQLTIDGTDHDGTLPSSLFLDFFVDPTRTPVSWSRKYNAGNGLSGMFTGCFGQTQYNHGALFLDFKSSTSGGSVKFTWWFDYYITSNVREHFGVMSDYIPFVSWNGGNASGRVTGKFDTVYYLKEGHTVVSPYVSLTNGAGRYFDFTLTIQKVP